MQTLVLKRAARTRSNENFRLLAVRALAQPPPVLGAALDARTGARRAAQRGGRTDEAAGITDPQPVRRLHDPARFSSIRRSHAPRRSCATCSASVPTAPASGSGDAIAVDEQRADRAQATRSTTRFVVWQRDPRPMSNAVASSPSSPRSRSPVPRSPTSRSRRLVTSRSGSATSRSSTARAAPRSGRGSTSRAARADGRRAAKRHQQPAAGTTRGRARSTPGDVGVEPAEPVPAARSDSPFLRNPAPLGPGSFWYTDGRGTPACTCRQRAALLHRRGRPGQAHRGVPALSPAAIAASVAAGLRSSRARSTSRPRRAG